MATPTGDDLTPVELLVLSHAGGDNDTGIAYGLVQLHAVFEREDELVDVTQRALLRLLDLGLVRFVEAPREVGYTAKRHELPAMSRDQFVAELERERDSTYAPDTKVFYDLTPAGEAALEAVPQERIPQVSGNVRRPWLE